MKPILLIGEAPAPDPSKTNLHLCLALNAIGRRPARGAPARLRREDPALFEFVRQTEHVNLLPYWPGYDRRGSAFPMAEARQKAAEFRRVIFNSNHDIVLFAGRRVAAAFEIHPHHVGWGYFQPRGFRWKNTPPLCYMVPHPSGVNRWWNDEANRELCRDFLVGLALEGIAW